MYEIKVKINYDFLSDTHASYFDNKVKKILDETNIHDVVNYEVKKSALKTKCLWIGKVLSASNA